MIGAVIGDLAAWTWEHDRDCFYRKLVSDDARLSGYGILPIVMWKPINEGGLIHKNRMYVTIGKALMHARPAGIEIPESWRVWGMSEYDNGTPFDLKIALISSAFVDSGYLPKERQMQLDWVSFFHGGKQEVYASNIMTILSRLNEGATKDEAIKDIPEPVFDYYTSGQIHEWKDYLEYVTFAWRCFYYSWDFTSALHNAAKCSGNLHLAMMLTGAFAEAMYGCDYSMNKQKFGGHYEYITLPETVNSVYGLELKRVKCHDFNFRYFFKKNEALSNVESHTWHNIENPYSDIQINGEYRKLIMRAYHTSWDYRYGVYLDNGWFYIYRSHCILFRFRLKQVGEKEYMMSELQQSNDSHGDIGDVNEVLHAVRILAQT